MKLSSLLFAPLAALALSSAASAQEVAVQLQSAAPPVQPALWQVADADTTIYLFGTVHLLPQGIDWFNGPLAEAFAASDVLVTEIPETDPAAMQSALLKRAILPPGQSLRALLGPKDLPKYEAALQGFGLPPTAFDRFKPWYAAVVLTTLPLQQQGYNVANGVEAQLAERNTARRAPRIGLETLDQQLALFDGFSPAVQKRYLMDVVEALPTINEEVRGMIAAWSKGDAEDLARLMNAEADDPAMIEVLLIARNRAWVQWIRKRMEQPGTVFLAVGAGHLGGRDNVREELTEAGLTVVRVQ